MHVPITKRTFGNFWQMRGAVATKRSMPFRYAKRETTTIVTARCQYKPLSGKTNLPMSVEGGFSAGLNWSATSAFGITYTDCGGRRARRTVFSRMRVHIVSFSRGEEIPDVTQYWKHI